MIGPAASVRRLVLDISPLMAAYLLFLAALGLLLDFIWLRHPYGNPMLLPGVLLALNGSMIASKVPVWRMLPVAARDIDRARWWHSVGAPGSVLALLLLISMLLLAGTGHASWRDIGLDIGLAWGGQFACCVTMAVVWMAMPLARRKWGRWSGLVLIPLLLIYFRLVTPEHGDLRPSLHIIIPVAILTALALYLMAGRWPLPHTIAMWAAPSGEEADTGSRLSGWPVLIRANLTVWLWLWGVMVFVCLALKWFLPGFDLNLFGWIFGLMSAQFAVTNLAAAMRVFRALPLSGARLTAMLVLSLLCLQGLSLGLFRLVLAATEDQVMPAIAFLAPLVFPLLYFPAALRFGMRVAQIGYALSIMVIAPFQLMSRDAGSAPLAVAGLIAIAALAVLWIGREIGHGHRAYRVQPLVPARWRGAD